MSHEPEVACDNCGRRVPVAPHYFNVSVPHVKTYYVGYFDAVVENAPCPGNEKRRGRDGLAHPATRLALQHAILDDDRYWEGL